MTSHLFEPLSLSSWAHSDLACSHVCPLCIYHINGMTGTDKIARALIKVATLARRPATFDATIGKKETNDDAIQNLLQRRRSGVHPISRRLSLTRFADRPILFTFCHRLLLYWFVYANGNNVARKSETRVFCFAECVSFDSCVRNKIGEFSFYFFFFFVSFAMFVVCCLHLSQAQHMYSDQTTKYRFFIFPFAPFRCGNV